VDFLLVIVTGIDVVVAAQNPGLLAIGNEAGPAEAYDVIIDVVQPEVRQTHHISLPPLVLEGLHRKVETWHGDPLLGSDIPISIERYVDIFK